jgi:hypothetical protein
MKAEENQLVIVKQRALNHLKNKWWARGQEEDLAQDVVLVCLVSKKHRQINSLCLDAARKMHLVGRAQNPAKISVFQFDFSDLCNLPAPPQNHQIAKIADLIDFCATLPDGLKLQNAIKSVCCGNTMARAAAQQGWRPDQLHRRLRRLGQAWRRREAA